MLDYNKILKNNLVNVFKDILNHIKLNGLQTTNQFYITFQTNHNKVEMPNWLRKKYPFEMTIVLQHEYYDLIVNNNYFSITLSFQDIKSKLKIDYDSIISFADPSVNFGLVLKKNIIEKKEEKSKQNNNVINFSHFKKT